MSEWQKAKIKRETVASTADVIVCTDIEATYQSPMTAVAATPRARWTFTSTARDPSSRAKNWETDDAVQRRPGRPEARTSLETNFQRDGLVASCPCWRPGPYESFIAQNERLPFDTRLETVVSVRLAFEPETKHLARRPAHGVCPNGRFRNRSARTTQRTFLCSVRRRTRSFYVRTSFRRFKSARDVGIRYRIIL